MISAFTHSATLLFYRERNFTKKKFSIVSSSVSSTKTTLHSAVSIHVALFLFIYFRESRLVSVAVCGVINSSANVVNSFQWHLVLTFARGSHFKTVLLIKSIKLFKQCRPTYHSIRQLITISLANPLYRTTRFGQINI